MNTIPQPSEQAIAIAATLYYVGREEGGITLRLDRYGVSMGEYKGKGFVVGGKLPGIKVTAKRGEHVEQSIEAIARWVQALPLGVDYVGSWLDGDTLYVDANDILSSSGEALDLARERGEKAIYDLTEGADIVVGPPIAYQPIPTGVEYAAKELDRVRG